MNDINRRAVPRFVHAPGPGAGTSLTPYGMSFWALILTACGGGGGGGGGGNGPETAGTPPPEEEKSKNGGPVTVSSPTQLPGEQPPLEPPQSEPPQSESLSGHVYDGPVKGADVYVDSDGDGALNKEVDHLVGTTNEQGAFSGSVPRQHAGKRYIVDLSSATDLGDDGVEGTSDDQDLSGFGIWLAPEGASVVSALTHLIATGVMTREEVQSAIPDFNPLTDNPYNSDSTDLTEAKQEAFRKIRKVLPTITSLVEKERDAIDRSAVAQEGDDSPQLSEAQRKVLDDLNTEINNIIKNPDDPHAPVLVQFGTAAINEGILTEDTDTGLRFRATDVNSGEDGYRAPRVALSGDGRFGIENGKIVAISGSRFISGEPITLTLTATDGNNINLVDTETIIFTIGDIEYAPVVSRANSATLALNETTSSTAADTGLRFRVTDADGNFTGPPTASDSRFELRAAASGEDWELWVKAGKTFRSGEDVSLTVTATDATTRSGTSTPLITFTVGDIQHAPVLALRGTANVSEGTLTQDTDSGLTFGVTDADSGEAGYRAPTPTLTGDNRFKIVDDKIVAKSGSNFRSGEAISLTLTATDGNNTSLADTKEISFTITFTDKNNTPHKLDADPNTPGDQPFLVAIRNEDERPTELRLMDPADSSRDAPDIDIDEVTPTSARKVADIHIKDDGIGTNVLEIKTDWASRVFEIKNGTELWLKAGQVIDRADAGTRTVTVGFTDTTSGHGTNPRDVSFTVTINDVAEAPVLARHGTAKELPSRTGREPFDTGIVFILSDPDNLDGETRQDVEMLPLIVKIDGAVVSGDFFELVQDTSYIAPPRSTPGQKKYTLMVKAGQDLSDLAGRSVTLTIKGQENGSHGSLKSNVFEETLNVAAARVSTTPETPDTRDGQTGAPDIRKVDVRYGDAASADRINNLESGDRIRIKLEYVWLKSYSRTIGSSEDISVFGIYSPHDLSLEDNHLAFMVNSTDTVNFPDVFRNVGYSNKFSYFTPWTAGSSTITKAYYLLEANERNAPLSNSYNRNEAFVIDTTPSDESDAVKITNFRPGEGDALVFTGSDIYWQVKYDAGGFRESPSYKLVFYSTKVAGPNNVLAVLDGYTHDREGNADFVAPIADLFLNVGGNKPNLHVIPVERKHYDTSEFVTIFNPSTREDEPHYILQPLEGVNLVTDYFNPLYSRFISGVQIRNNEPALITNFEDGRDKIMLDVGEESKYWWKEISEERPSAEIGAPPDTIKVIELYNTATPVDGRKDQIIARILDFDGTFSDDDFIHADGTAVNSGQIIEIL